VAAHPRRVDSAGNFHLALRRINDLRQVSGEPLRYAQGRSQRKGERAQNDKLKCFLATWSSPKLEGKESVGQRIE
jgi:hypothetical protein